MSQKSIGEKIERVSKKRSGFCVEFEGGEKIVLSEDAFTEFRLYDGKVLSDHERKRLGEIYSQDSYYSYALRLLSHDMVSVHQIREKLTAKGAEPETVNKIVQRLKKTGLLDDERYARTYASDVGDLRLYGRNKILAELKMKGIPFSLLSELEFPEEKELDKALRYGRAVDARSGKTPYDKKKFKIVKSLLQRGYDLRIAEEAAEKVTTHIDPKDEEQALDRQYALAKGKYSKKYFGYELKQHILAYLVRRGFDYDKIKEKLQEVEE